MANRWFNQFRLSLEKQVVDLFLRATFDASGNMNQVTADSKGISSVSRTSAGKYVITLQDSYQKLLALSKVAVKTTAPTAPLMYLYADSVNTLAAPTLTVIFTNTSGTATDPASGEEVRMSFSLRNSSAP